MPGTHDLLKELQSLAKLDVDAVHLYTSAIDHIDLPEVKQHLTLFRTDHERHITDLTPFIVSLGGEPPTRTPDLKGYLLQGFTAMRSMMGNESALKAMKTNEELTNKTYQKALEMDFPTDIKNVVQRNRNDEYRHLDYINRCISERVWDKQEKGVA